MTTPHLVAGIGELLWDMLPGGKELGGAPGNFAWHVHALGVPALVISSVGDDEDGREILGRLDRLGLRRGLVGVDPSHPTGRSTVSLDASGVPSFHVHEDVAWDFIPWTPALERAASQVDAVDFGTLGQRSRVSRETTRLFLSAMRSDAIRLFDLNLRAPHYTREVVEASLTYANVLKLNEEEFAVLSSMFDWRGGEAERLGRLADAYGLRLAALTRGERGSVLYAGGRISAHAGVKARVVDTVGAGDAFGAAIVVGLLRGTDIDVINERANRLASYVCSEAGATPEPPRELVEWE